MTKAEIATRIQMNLGYSHKESRLLLEMVFDIMKSTLESGDNLKITGFGHFQVKKKNARKGRNPQTGEAIMLEPRQILTFKPSTLLRKRINEG
jgi:integration host factor subunit alpha